MKNIHPHMPVMLEETISHLFTDPSGIYLDGTIGYGGHTSLLIKKLSSKGKIIGLDLDPGALKYTKKRLSHTQDSYSLYHRNFREYPKLLQKLGINKLTGILFDFGSSSSQIDSGHRGFSYQNNGPLDMRYDPGSKISAKDYLNNSNEKKISKVIKEYGEERYHARIAKNIWQFANNGKMNSTNDLKKAVELSVGSKFLTKSLSRVFQAIRIKINDELKSIKVALEQSSEWLVVGGRIVVISFHSLEDRLVKHFFINKVQDCTCPKSYPICICNTIPEYNVLTKKPIKPSIEEQTINSRSRSAKLRAAERI